MALLVLQLLREEIGLNIRKPDPQALALDASPVLQELGQDGDLVLWWLLFDGNLWRKALFG